MNNAYKNSRAHRTASIVFTRTQYYYEGAQCTGTEYPLILDDCSTKHTTNPGHQFYNNSAFTIYTTTQGTN
jgi:hypothetical protein